MLRRVARPDPRSKLPIQAVLFDATGTLIELREPVGESYARMAARHGVTLPAWRIGDGFKRILAGRAPRVFPDAAPQDVAARERDWWRAVVRDSFRAADQTLRFADFEAFFDELFTWYAGAEAWQLRPGCAEALTALAAQGLALGVVSDFDYRLTEVLDALDIAVFFQTVTLAGPHRISKPDRRLFEAALDALGVAASNAVYVGDDPDRDLAGAASAGLQAVDVTNFASLTELTRHLATLAPLESPLETR